MPRGRKKQRHLVVLIDQDNIDSALRSNGEKLDFAELMKELLKIGEVKFAFIFVPFASYHSLPRVNNLGYEIIVCQKLDFNHSEKREDKVDSRMAMIGKSFLEYKEITDVIIMTHDKHSLELASEVVKSGKQLTYIATKDQLSNEIKEFIENYNIPVFIPPSKPRPNIRNLIH